VANCLSRSSCFRYEDYQTGHLLYIQWGFSPDPHSEMKKRCGVALGEFTAHGVTYLLQIRKWVYHVYALCSALVLIHHPLDSVHFATSLLKGSCSAVTILRFFYTNFYFLVQTHHHSLTARPAAHSTSSLLPLRPTSMSWYIHYPTSNASLIHYQPGC